MTAPPPAADGPSRPTLKPCPPRVVLDTNLLVAAAYRPESASGRLVAACLEGRLQAVATAAVQREYTFILPRAVRSRDASARLRQWLDCVQQTAPAPGQHIVPGDPDDDKLLSAAVGARADALITNDRLLLALHPYHNVAIVRPGRFCERWWRRSPPALE